jgi:hypothetical protein
MDSIRVMISSRVGAPLSRGRKAPTIGNAAEKIKAVLGEQLLFPGAGFKQDPLFEFDLSLEDSERPADKPIEQQCREMAADADIVLALYNGDAGSQLRGNADGICFLEMRAAMDFAPEKLVVVSLPQKARPTEADRRFREWFAAQKIWTAPRTAGDLDAVVDATRHALRVALAKMVQHAGHVRLGGFHLGGALEWSRMTYQDRAAAMRHAVYKSLRPHGRELKGPGEGETTLFALGRGKQQVFTWIHAIPAAISEPHAREMVGQPHLSDHKLNAKLGDMPGPLHVVACARGVTEAQAVRILGFPDAIIIKAPFGVFVADEVQKIQMAFLAQCRDEPTTRDAVTQFVGWLDQTGERDSILARGELRSELVTVLAKEVR